MKKLRDVLAVFIISVYLVFSNQSLSDGLPAQEAREIEALKIEEIGTMWKVFGWPMAIFGVLGSAATISGLASTSESALEDTWYIFTIAGAINISLAVLGIWEIGHGNDLQEKASQIRYGQLFNKEQLKKKNRFDLNQPEEEKCGVCTPKETQPCGKCGIQVCLLSCQWGSCKEIGECSPGETRSCGKCGTQICLRTCQWSDCKMQEGVCFPGETKPCQVNKTQTCSPACEWEECR